MSRPRDLAERAPIAQPPVEVQPQGGNSDAAKKLKIGNLHNAGGGTFAHTPDRNTPYNGARVANIQRKGPHR